MKIFLYLYCIVALANASTLYTNSAFIASVDIEQTVHGDEYFMHRNTGGYAFYKTDEDNVSALTSLSANDLSLFSLSEESDMYVDDFGVIHLLISGCSSNLASSCTLYYMSYDTSWSAKESLIGTVFNPKKVHIKKGSDNSQHVSFIYSDTNNIEHLMYSTNKSGTWITTEVITATNPDSDEITKNWLLLDSNDIAHLYYVRENNQDVFSGNLYSKTSEDSFSVETLVVDGLSDAISYIYNDVYINPFDSIHINYSTKNDSTDESFMYDKEGLLDSVIVGLNTHFERGYYRYNSGKWYMLVLQSSINFTQQNLILFSKKGSALWKEEKNISLPNIYVNEFVFNTDSSHLTILFQENNLENVDVYTQLNQQEKRSFLPAIYFELFN